MFDFVTAAEDFQYSVNSTYDLCWVHDDASGYYYFVPYRRDGLIIALFGREGRWDISLSDFQREFPKSFTAWGAQGIDDTATPERIGGQLVYFIGDGRRIKIGVSKNPQKRLASLQTANVNKLSLLHVCCGGREAEFQLHGRFRTKHVRGEWFEDCPEIREFIAANNNEPERRAAA